MKVTPRVYVAHTWSYRILRPSSPPCRRLRAARRSTASTEVYTPFSHCWPGSGPRRPTGAEFLTAPSELAPLSLALSSGGVLAALPGRGPRRRSERSARAVLVRRSSLLVCRSCRQRSIAAATAPSRATAPPDDTANLPTAALLSSRKTSDPKQKVDKRSSVVWLTASAAPGAAPAIRVRWPGPTCDGGYAPAA